MRVVQQHYTITELLTGRDNQRINSRTLGASGRSARRHGDGVNRGR
ncbi:hypothetical protein [Rhodococcus sp. ACT016]